jgi:hypothetical protein
MRVQNPRRAGASRKTRKETHRLTSLHDSVFEARSACSVLGPRKEERGRRGAPPEMGARATRSARKSRAGGRRPDASRTRLVSGPLPTAACAVRSIVHCHRIPETRIRGRNPGAANDAGRLDSRRSMGDGPCPTQRVPPRSAEPGARMEDALEGRNPRRAPARQQQPRPGLRPPRERILEGSKASKRACRRLTDEPGHGERIRRGRGAQAPRRADPVWWGSAVLAHASGKPQGEPRQRVGAAVKARRTLAATAPATVEPEPAREQRLARASTALREGKALKGSSRDASGMEQGREAPGRQEHRGSFTGSARSRRGENRREGTNPEDGTGEGVATFTLTRLLSSSVG